MRNGCGCHGLARLIAEFRAGLEAMLPRLDATTLPIIREWVEAWGAIRAKGIEISHLGHSREGALWRIAPIRTHSTATPPGVEGGIRYGAHRE